MGNLPSIYTVIKTSTPVTPDADWNRQAWQGVTSLELKNHMGANPEHWPKTQARLLYNKESLSIIFRVMDQFVLATAASHQDSVCRDSCVEFFFTPGTELGDGYFNIELNCGGTMLFHHQLERSTQPTIIDVADIKQMQIASSLPKKVDPEIPEKVIWAVEYRIPFTVLKKYAPVAMPGPGVEWRANFYKCADNSSHPHWLTWSYVDKPEPDFHLKQYFGTLLFT